MYVNLYRPIKVAVVSLPLSSGTRFSFRLVLSRTFVDFLETSNAYCYTNKELYVRKNNVTIEVLNKSIKKEENKFPAASIYKAIQF